MISDHLLESASDYTGVANAEDALGVVITTAAGNYVSTESIGILFGYAASLVAGAPGFLIGRFVGKLAADVIIGIGLAAFGKIVSKKLSAMWHQVASHIVDPQPAPAGEAIPINLQRRQMLSQLMGSAVPMERRPVKLSRSHYARLTSQHLRYTTQPHPVSRDNGPEVLVTSA